jgi:hypothetical protein
MGRERVMGKVKVKVREKVRVKVQGQCCHL